MSNYYVETLISILLVIIGYITKSLVDKVKELEEGVNKNRMEIEIIKQNHDNLRDKFDQLYDLIKEISKEVKGISITLVGKKDKE